jgi:hypothetical protein
MKKSDQADLKTRALWVAEAAGIALLYLGAFAVLMLPVIDAATNGTGLA